MKRYEKVWAIGAVVFAISFVSCAGKEMTQQQKEVRQFITSVEKLTAEAEKAGKKGNEKALEKLYGQMDELIAKNDPLSDVMDEKDKAWIGILCSRAKDAFDGKLAKEKKPKKSKENKASKGKGEAGGGDVPQSQGADSSANPPTDFRYVLNKEGLGIILVTFLSTDKSVIVPDAIEGIPVVSFADSVFFNEKEDAGMDYVRVPNTVVTVGNQALRKARKVDIDLSKVQSAGASAFRNANIVHTGASDGPSAFSSMEVIGASAFRNATIKIDGKGAADVDLSAVKKMGAFAFQESNIEGKVTVHSGCEYGLYSDWTSTYGGQFKGTGVTEAIIENGVQTVPNDIFSDCYSLKSLTIPASVTVIGARAFDGTAAAFRHDSALETVNMAPGIKIRYAGDNAFRNCTSLNLDTRQAIRDSGYGGAF